MEGYISKAVHYRSFYEVTKMMNDSAKLEFYVALDKYRFDGVEPVFTHNEAQIAFTVIRSFVDADIKRKSGGAPMGNSNARKQPKNNVENNPKNNIRNNLKTMYENNPKNNIENNIKTNNVNVNDNVNVNVNVNDNSNVVSAKTDGGDFINKITSASVQEHLKVMGYDVNATSCGMIASILNKQKFPLEYCEYVENKVSDKYPEISTGLMVNALTTWNELYEDFKKELKQKEKKNEKILERCVKCGSELGSLNWINGRHHCYFCTTCGTNFVKQKSGEWKEEATV